jgi:hypothetical protein
MHQACLEVPGCLSSVGGAHLQHQSLMAAALYSFVTKQADSAMSTMQKACPAASQLPAVQQRPNIDLHQLR